MRFVTKGDADLKDRPHVFFAALPDERATYLDRIAKDLWQYSDCAVFFRDEDFCDEKRALEELDPMQLLVVPVTLSLLAGENPIVTKEIPYAQKKNIPILPIMMESGLDSLYSETACFGKLQYLDPNSTDATAIGYGDKLRRYLDAVLVKREEIKRLRRAFAASLFLSYRKIDRAYANRLICLIHEDARFRDIAVWYDEFLTPGESFSASIEDCMRESAYVLLLITPNTPAKRLDTDGVWCDNYIVAHEYPLAVKLQKALLPIEALPTAPDALTVFPSLPKPIPIEDREAIALALDRALPTEALTRDDSPSHLYDIGRCYLYGINAEIDRPRAVALITEAAEGDCPEALEQLALMYANGIALPIDYKRAAELMKTLADRYRERLGEDAPDTMRCDNEYGLLLLKSGAYREAVSVFLKLYDTYRRVKGEGDLDTLATLDNLASCYGYLSEYGEALRCATEAQAVREREGVFDEDDAFTAYNNMATYEIGLERYEEALSHIREAYAIALSKYGSEDPRTETVRANEAYCLGMMGDHEKALTIFQAIHKARVLRYGEEHPFTLEVLNNVAYTLGELKRYEEATALHKKAFLSREIVLGETHPDTLKSLSNYAFYLGMTGQYEKALELHRAAYRMFSEKVGKEHFDTLNAMNNVGYTLYDMGRYEEAVSVLSEVLILCRKLYGEENARAVQLLETMTECYARLGNLREALLCREETCRIYHTQLEDPKQKEENLLRFVKECECYRGCADILSRAYELLYLLAGELYGAMDERTIGYLARLGHCLVEEGRIEEALPMFQHAYGQAREVLGEGHPAVFMILQNLGYCHQALKQYREAERVYMMLYRMIREGKIQDTRGIVVVLSSFADCSEALKKIPQAIALYETLCGLLERIYGKESVPYHNIQRKLDALRQSE